MFFFNVICQEFGRSFINFARTKNNLLKVNQINDGIETNYGKKKEIIEIRWGIFILCLSFSMRRAGEWGWYDCEMKWKGNGNCSTMSDVVPNMRS